MVSVCQLCPLLVTLKLTSTTSQLPSLASSNAISLPQNLTHTEGTHLPKSPKAPRDRIHPVHHTKFLIGSVL